LHQSLLQVVRHHRHYTIFLKPTVTSRPSVPLVALTVHYKGFFLLTHLLTVLIARQYGETYMQQ